MKTRLTAEQFDRAQGVLLGTAAGDALGAGYEFGPPLDDGTPVAMNGGGPFDWEPGEWTDDTSMALAIAEVAASGADLRETGPQDAIVARWASWAADAADVGTQTRQVLTAVTRAGARTGGRAGTGDGGDRAGGGPVAGGVGAGGVGAGGVGAGGAAAVARAGARQLHEATGRSGGNGSLMRTAPVALAYLGDPDGLAEAATALSALTHYDEQAGEACVLWCLAIRHAVLTGELDVRAGLTALPRARRTLWAERLAEAERGRPRDFEQNGWVVHALQGAWSAIAAAGLGAVGPRNGESGTGASGASASAAGGSGASASGAGGSGAGGSGAAGAGAGGAAAGGSGMAGPGSPGWLRLALEGAVRGGRDTDTVAAIAGGLAGGACGASAVPAQWREKVHGWPGLRAAGLAELTAAIVR